MLSLKPEDYVKAAGEVAALAKKIAALTVFRHNLLGNDWEVGRSAAWDKILDNWGGISEGDRGTIIVNAIHAGLEFQINELKKSLQRQYDEMAGVTHPEELVKIAAHEAAANEGR
jgi:hypothetical protein